jgi:peptidyl-prolyl cis-trans isomerase B (cyclophilin B)
MTGFNQLYYTFSPTIADFERENSIFRETVKLAITPMLASLSILNHVNIDSEQEMLGYGISIILMNVGMYFVAPAMLIHRLRK